MNMKGKDHLEDLLVLDGSILAWILTKKRMEGRGLH